jgi:hypothetical protein
MHWYKKNVEEESVTQKKERMFLRSQKKVVS